MMKICLTPSKEVKDADVADAVVNLVNPVEKVKNPAKENEVAVEDAVNLAFV